jgi:hypothetical protein
VWRGTSPSGGEASAVALSCANLAVRGILKLACLGSRARRSFCFDHTVRRGFDSELGPVFTPKRGRCAIDQSRVLGPAWASTDRAAFRRRYPLNGLKLTLNPCEFGFSVLDTRQFGSSLGSSFCCLGELLAAELLVIQRRNINGG